MPAVDELALRLDTLTVAAGQEVFHQGDHGNRFYVIEDGEGTATVRARTLLRLYSLDRHHFLSAVTGYESSEREAETLVLDRLSVFNPAH